MRLTFNIANSQYHFDSDWFHDVSQALNFNKEQPKVYGVENATSVAYSNNNFIGDTRQGGVCNFESLKLVPHCNGTHTECIGHISNNRLSIHDQLQKVLIPNTLISLSPLKRDETKDTYHPQLNHDDLLITRKLIEDALTLADSNFLEALTIRTLPNKESKLNRNYEKIQAPFFSIEAMEFIVKKGVNHLLVDMPSVDRILDDGKLTAHRIFWNLKQGGHDIDTSASLNKTITEMIYVADHIADGKYLLNLQIAPFVSDASPSRPILFDIIED